MIKNRSFHQSLTSRFQTRVVPVLAGGALLLLLSGCAFPRKDLAGMPDVNVIRVTQHDGEWRAQAPDCQPLLQPSQYNYFHNLRMSIAFGCATYSNLAASVARPADLVQPRVYVGTHADTVVTAVERYRLNDIEPLRETTSTSLTGN